MLVVLERMPRTQAGGNIQWRCMCDCGNETVKRGSHMVSGKVKACGCQMNGPGRGMATTEGVEHLKMVWESMRSRCRPTSKDAASYFDRGIRVCGRWAESFPAFVEDVGVRPRGDLSLDRIENDRGYEPGNVRWTTMRVQSLNMRRSDPQSWELAEALHRELLLELTVARLRRISLDLLSL